MEDKKKLERNFNDVVRKTISYAVKRITMETKFIVHVESLGSKKLPLSVASYLIRIKEKILNIERESSLLLLATHEGRARFNDLKFDLLDECGRKGEEFRPFIELIQKVEGIMLLMDKLCGVGETVGSINSDPN